MNRRNFIKNLGVLLASTQLPTRLLDGVELAADTIVINEWRHVTYAVGFIISREVIEDDIYGQMMGSQEQIAVRSAKFARLQAEYIFSQHTNPNQEDNNC